MDFCGPSHIYSVSQPKNAICHTHLPTLAFSLGAIFSFFRSGEPCSPSSWMMKQLSMDAWEKEWFCTASLMSTPQKDKRNETPIYWSDRQRFWHMPKRHYMTLPKSTKVCFGQAVLWSHLRQGHIQVLEKIKTSGLTSETWASGGDGMGIPHGMCKNM